MRRNNSNSLFTQFLQDPVIGSEGELAKKEITLSADQLSRLLFDSWMQGMTHQAETNDPRVRAMLFQERYNLSIQQEKLSYKDFKQYYDLSTKYWKRHNEIVNQYLNSPNTI